MSIKAMKQALEALEFYYDLHEEDADSKVIATLRAAIEQAQEPVAWLVQYPNKHEFVWGEKPQWIANAVGIEPLYTAPRQWQGLTADEIWNEWNEQTKPERNTQIFVAAFARAIEAKLKEKNT